MQASTRILVATLAALAWCPAAVTHENDAAAVLAQDLRELEVPGKVVAALWTRRKENFTLQLVYPYQGRGSAFIQNTIARMRQQNPFGTGTDTQREFRPWEPPSVQAWLLRPDGTVIMPRSTSTPGFSPEDTAREVHFTFPLSVAGEANAVAVNIDGQYRVQKLEPFRDQAR